MAGENEYSNYSVEELNNKSSKYKRMQQGMMIMSVVFSAIIGLVSYIKDSDTGYQVIPILLLAGTIYPLITFGSMRKKILKEIATRES